MKSVTEKGLGKVGSVFVALRRDKGASKYNEADVSAFPQKVFPPAPTSVPLIFLLPGAEGSGAEGPLDIIAAAGAVKVQNFSGKKKSFDKAAFKGFRIDFLKGDTSFGDHCLMEIFRISGVEGEGSEIFKEFPGIFSRIPGKGGFRSGHDIGNKPFRQIFR